MWVFRAYVLYVIFIFYVIVYIQTFENAAGRTIYTGKRIGAAPKVCAKKSAPSYSAAYLLEVNGKKLVLLVRVT